jgi:hypothetical protein
LIASQGLRFGVPNLSWRDVEYRLEEWCDPHIADVVSAINRTHVNGGALLRCFRPTSPAFEDAYHRDLQGLPYMLRAFLESNSVRRLVPELAISVPIEPFPAFIAYGSYEFEGAITALLLSTGAYVSSTMNAATARSMASSFVDSLLADARDQGRIFRISDAWSEWFCDVAWDISFAVFDPVGRRWWLLCVTDTD